MRRGERERDGGVEAKRRGVKVGIVIGAIGFLVILVCGGGLFLVTWFASPVVLEASAHDLSLVCQSNLRCVHGGLLTYRVKYRRFPPESGVAFLAALYATESLKYSESSALRLTCPAVDLEALAIGSLPWDQWWVDLERLDSTWSAYAGRDMAKFPMERLSGREVIAACDNEHGQNHPDETHVLYGDGSIQTFSLAALKREGIVPEDADRLVVGPDSPIEDLRKLSLD